MKNAIKKIILRQPGIKKNKSIAKILTNITIVMIGPYIVSTKVKAKVLSRIPKSLENLFVSWPVGVRSK